jgi:hypothetical protein
LPSFAFGQQQRLADPVVLALLNLLVVDALDLLEALDRLAVRSSVVNPIGSDPVLN